MGEEGATGGGRTSSLSGEESSASKSGRPDNPLGMDMSPGASTVKRTWRSRLERAKYPQEGPGVLEAALIKGIKEVEETMETAKEVEAMEIVVEVEAMETAAEEETVEATEVEMEVEMGATEVEVAEVTEEGMAEEAVTMEMELVVIKEETAEVTPVKGIKKARGEEEEERVNRQIGNPSARTTEVKPGM
jgi:hypothetical protein